MNIRKMPIAELLLAAGLPGTVQAALSRWCHKIILALLVAPGLASAGFTYDYDNEVAFDSTTGYYWRLSPAPADGSWQDATVDGVHGLFFGAPFSPSQYSKETSDLVLFFATNQASPQVNFSNRLPVGNLGNPTACSSFSNGETCFGLRGFASWGPSDPNSYDFAYVAYSGSANILLNDWYLVKTATIAAFSRDGFLYEGFDIGQQPVFQYSLTAPVPEPETYAMMLVGFGLVGVAVRRRKQLEA